MKHLTHLSLLQLVTEFTPGISQDGVCNGFTSMWLQAALTSKQDLALFYQRLDEISLELKQKTPADLKAEIDSIYHKNTQNINKASLSDENIKKTELRAFAEAVAIQQDTGTFFKGLDQNDKKILNSLTASEKMEEQQIKLNTDHLPNLNLNLSELELYLEKIQHAIQHHTQNETIGFMICNVEHATGVYLDPDSGKFHFIDINRLTNKPSYDSEVDCKALAKLIFDSFGMPTAETYCPIKLQIFSTSKNHVTLSETITDMTLKTDQSFFKKPEDPFIKQQALLQACEDGDTEKVGLLLKEADIEKILNTPCPQTKKTPLYLACEQGHTEIVKLLLAHGNKELIKNIEKPIIKTKSALSVAKKYDHIEIVTLLKSVLPPPKKYKTLRFTVGNDGSLKRKAEEGDLDERPAKKPNNTFEMEQEPPLFPRPIM